MTYIYTVSDGWCYLSSIYDLHSRKIIAWRLSRQMETRLVIETLQDALSKRTVADGLIIHSDRGSQYTSKEYNDYLEHHSIRHSYSAKGCPYDIVVQSHFTQRSKRSVFTPKLMLVIKIFRPVTIVFLSISKDFIIRGGVTAN